MRINLVEADAPNGLSLRSKRNREMISPAWALLAALRAEIQPGNGMGPRIRMRHKSQPSGNREVVESFNDVVKISCTPFAEDQSVGFQLHCSSIAQGIL